MMKLRPKLEPHLKKQGLTFEDAIPALEQVDTIEELQAALANPSEFLENLAKSTGPAAKKLAMMKLRPKLEPHLKKQGLTFEDAIPALEQVDTIEELQAALANPSEFLENLAKSIGPAAKKFAMMKLRPKLKPHLKEQGLTFEDVIPALEQVDTVEELQAALANPSEFLENLAKSMGSAAKKLA